jgi:K+-transporting ATPase ATPase A chain
MRWLLQLAFYIVLTNRTGKAAARRAACIYEDQPAWLQSGQRAVRRLIYRLCGVDSSRMGWIENRSRCFIFNCSAAGRIRPAAPQSASAVQSGGDGSGISDSSFNTAISFMTNTNWQGSAVYLSYLTQMAALGVQNFLSAATGMVVVIALIRGFARQTARTIGNFWVDMTRTTLYILLPLSFVFALVLVSQGVVQTFSAYPTVPLVE